jgi:hypothetical protein
MYYEDPIIYYAKQGIPVLVSNWKGAWLLKIEKER